MTDIIFIIGAALFISMATFFLLAKKDKDDDDDVETYVCEICNEEECVCEKHAKESPE